MSIPTSKAIDVAFINGTVILDDRLLAGGTVVCQGGQIVEITDENRNLSNFDTVDCGGCYVSPGFIDLHVHGGNGADFMDGTVDAVQTACRSHLLHGTTTIFPTTTTGSASQILDMIVACKEARGSANVPHIEGVHLYGPYFAPDKVGCHSVDGRRDPSLEEYNRYFDTGMIKIATCAAELNGAAEFYEKARQHNCLITCGHSNASWAEMQAAFEKGVRHVDHFWCAMSSVPSLRQRLGVPMQASMAEFVLMQKEMSTEVIADGCHLSPELLEFAYQMLGVERLCLVTDCNRALDLPAGRYRFGNADDGSWFESDGRVGWAESGSLASSIVGMDHMVRTMYQNTSASLPDAIRMASLTPAQRAGVSSQTGSLAKSKRADILVLNEQLQVTQVFVNGTRLV